MSNVDMSAAFRMSREARQSRISIPWLAGLTLIGLALRIFHLNDGLWLDEMYSLVNQFRLGTWEIFTTYIGDNQHPLYAVLASLSVSLFGEHPWSIRLPAVLFGVATIPALYVFGTRVSSSREGLLAAALLTFSYHHVWFSQNARGYTALALAAILCSDYFIRIIREHKQKDMWLYAIIAALGCYAHLTMVFVVIGHFLVYLILQLVPDESGKRAVSWQLPLAGFVLAGVLTLLLYAPIMSQVVDYFVNKPSLKGLSTPLWALQEAIRSLSIGFGAGIIVAAGFTMFLIGVISYMRSNPVALGLFIMPIIITLLGALLARGTMYPRFFFSLIGFGILIGVRGVMVTAGFAARAVLRGADRESKSTTFATSVMVLVILVSAVSLVRNYQYPKMDFQGAREWLQAHAGARDNIVTAGAAAWPYKNIYGVTWPEMKHASDLEEQRRNADNVWIVYTFARYMEVSAPEVLTIIRQDCVDEKYFPGTLGGGEIIVCRLPSTGSEG